MKTTFLPHALGHGMHIVRLAGRSNVRVVQHGARRLVVRADDLARAAAVLSWVLGERIAAAKIRARCVGTARAALDSEFAA